MYTQNVIDAPHWYVIHTHPKQEDRADCNLRARNVETFAPKFRERRSKKVYGTAVDTTVHLFPRYIFARFNASKMLHNISFTRGVHSVVGFGSGPITIEDEIIAMIQEQVREDGLVNIGEELRSGDKVEITDGPFKNLKGVFEREMKGVNRVSILMTTMHYQFRVLVEKELVEKAG